MVFVRFSHIRIQRDIILPLTGILKSYEGTFVVYEGICSSLMVIRNDVGDFLVSCFAQRESPRSIVSKTLSKQLGGKTKPLRL